MAHKSAVLSPREEAFIYHFVRLRNQTKAYIEAGYAAQGAAQNAARLMLRDKVRDGIAAEEARVRARMGPTVERIIDSYAQLGFGGMSRFVRLDPHDQPYIDLASCSPADLDTLQEITTERFVEDKGQPTERTVSRVKIKIFDRYRALEKMSQHLGMFKGSAADVADALGDLLAEIQERGSAIPVKPQGPLQSLPNNRRRAN